MAEKLLKMLLPVLAALMVVSFSACGGRTESAETPAPAETPEPAPVVRVSPSPEPSADIEKLPVHTMPPTPAPAAKADYLNYKFAYSITGTTQGDMLAETAKDECAESFSRMAGTENITELMDQWVFDGVTPGDYSCGAVFLTWSADFCGLIDSGTFIRSTDLREIYEHFTTANEFSAKPLTRSTQFGGADYNVQTGDILFWIDDDGNELNAGIVTLAQGNRISVAVCSSESKVAEFVLESGQRDEHIVKNCILVNIIYPCNEQLVFLFLVNNMGYSNAAACGVMANIYCESLFEPNIEEVNFAEGYGLCQWTGARRAAMEMWCAANSLDNSRLVNQMLFMKNELENDIPGDLDWRLRVLSDSEEGAVAAGKLWCELFENPVGDVAKERGELAKTFYKAYSGHPFM